MTPEEKAKEIKFLKLDIREAEDTIFELDEAIRKETGENEIERLKDIRGGEVWKVLDAKSALNSLEYS